MTDQRTAVSVPRPPRRREGLVSVWRQRDVVRLLVRGDRSGRFRDSFLGAWWSYIPVLIRFAVYFFVLGYVLGLTRSVPNFPVYIFSGFLVTGFFVEAMNSSTRSLIRNRYALLHAPVTAELYPVTSVVTSTFRLGPPLLILLAAALLTGWRPNLLGLALALAGLGLVALFALAVGLLATATNVFTRDVKFGVEALGFVVLWASPVLYPLDLVEQALGTGLLYQVYLANPVTLGVLGVREGFWVPTLDAAYDYPDLVAPVAVGLGVTVFLLVLGQIVFNRLEPRFADAL